MGSKSKISAVLGSLGPGLLYAGAAIGVSHLVQSTRAGASYGWWPVIAIIFIHLAKYPFFKAGPAYALSTNTSLIQGYFNRGKVYVALFLLFTIGTMFAIIAAIVAVTSGVSAFFFGIEASSQIVAGGILTIAVVILLIGQYKWLDRFIKLIIFLLTICTLVAFGSALFDPSPHKLEALGPVFDGLFLAMLVKLMGWMPAPLDLSVWHSLWALEKKAELGGNLTKAESLRDFNFGYWGTMIMGVLFLGMGALILYGSHQEIPSSGVAFANMLIGMYTTQLGQWAFYIVGLAAVATMASTTLTCMDAIPRSLAECRKIAFSNDKKWAYPTFLIILAVGSFTLLSILSASMTTMVDIATVISFCSAPVIAWMNFKTVRGHEVPEKDRPSQISTIWEIASIFSLVALTVLFFAFG
ncbi:divalent metal cation transporter [Cryomorphaceae bacterium 1068]|nr:divalent metal cation transporter [Cryomorphaceae bacterium 1068]